MARRADGTVRIRATWEERVLLALPLLAALGFVLATPDLRRWGPLVAAAVLLCDVLSSRRGVTLTPEAAVVHSSFRSTPIAWARVEMVEVEHEGGCSVVLRTDDGTRVRLAEPSGWRGSRRFYATADIVGHWWAERTAPAPD